MAIGTVDQKNTKMFLSHHLRNPADSDKILYILSWVYLPIKYYICFPPHLNIMHLHYFVKLKIRIFVKIQVLVKRDMT